MARGRFGEDVEVAIDISDLRWLKNHRHIFYEFVSLISEHSKLFVLDANHPSWALKDYRHQTSSETVGRLFEEPNVFYRPWCFSLCVALRPSAAKWRSAHERLEDMSEES